MASRPTSLVVGDSWVHRLPAHLKVLAVLGFVVAVALTPREAFTAFAAYAVVLMLAVLAARLPLVVVLRRSTVELPFIVFALILPFVAGGPEVEVLGVQMSEAGLLSGWNVVAKASLGVVAAVLLSASTEPHDLVLGLGRLRLPAPLVEIAGFMVRYLDLVVDDVRRTRQAQAARGFEAGHLGHLPVLARTVGTVFVRTFERGERVHLAMRARGYTGTLPAHDGAPAPASHWVGAAALPVLAWLVLGSVLAPGLA